VALIDNAKKIIDGKVFDVREKFKKNIFSVTLSDMQNEAFEQFKMKYQINNIKQDNHLFSFDLKSEIDQKTILQDLLSSGNIRTYDEKIPSMNDVFINAVGAHN
jgi:ABC-2 type transport system ATP-binding protein